MTDPLSPEVEAWKQERERLDVDDSDFDAAIARAGDALAAALLVREDYDKEARALTIRAETAEAERDIALYLADSRGDQLNDTLAERDRLREALQTLSRQWRGAAEKAAHDLRESETECDEARAALKRFGKHTALCDDDQECICGFGAATTWATATTHPVIATAEAERDRLREALERLARCPKSDQLAARNAARAVLDKQQP